MAALFANVSVGLSAQFGGPYHVGAILGETGAVTAPSGAIVTPGTPSERACQVQIDAATEAMRQAAGFADGDVRFLILAATLDGDVDTDAVVRINTGPHAGTWLVSALSRDPFRACWSGLGRRA